MDAKIPILYVGPPGVGKTAKIKTQFDHVEILLLSSSTEEDIAGIPYHIKGTEYRTKPLWLTRLKLADEEGKTTCLFLDELDKARREVADTMLSLVVSKEQFGIPTNTFLRAAANPPEWGGGDGISDPMLSRWSIIDWEMDEKHVNEQLAFWSERYKDTRANSVIEKLLKIIETHGWVYSAGDGLRRRIASPRTMTMALDAYVASEDSKDIIGGLLPSAFVTAFIENEYIKTTVKRSHDHLTHPHYTRNPNKKRNILRVPLW